MLVDCFQYLQLNDTLYMLCNFLLICEYSGILFDNSKDIVLRKQQAWDFPENYKW